MISKQIHFSSIDTSSSSLKNVYLSNYNLQLIELLHYNNYLSYTFEKHKKYLFSFILSSMLFISSLSIQDYTSAVADQTFWKEDWRDHTQKITFQGSFYVVQTHFR